MAEHKHGGELREIQGTMQELTCSCGDVSYIFMTADNEPLVLQRQPANWTFNGVDYEWPPKTDAGNVEPEGR